MFHALLILFCAGAAHSEDDSIIIVRGGKAELKYELVLREEQGGVAGLRGTRWSIKPDGSWEVAKFKVVQSEDRVLENTRRKGKLTLEQVQSLVRELKSEKLLDIRSHLGTEEGINPHRYILIFGNHKIALEGVETRREGNIRDNILSGSPPMDQESARDRDRFANIASLIEDRTTS